MNALLLALAAAAPIPAAPSTLDRPTELVRYDDLDLTSASGRAVLEKRVSWAIRRVCDPPATPTTEAYEQVADCIHEASMNAAIQMQRIARDAEVATRPQRTCAGSSPCS